jgi:hypothetical protein
MLVKYKLVARFGPAGSGYQSVELPHDHSIILYKFISFEIGTNSSSRPKDWNQKYFNERTIGQPETVPPSLLWPGHF